MMKYITAIIIGLLTALSYFLELYILVPITIALTLAFILKNNEFYKKPEFLLGLITFVLVHSHWFLSLHFWTGLSSAVVIYLGISLYFFIILYLFFYLIKYLLRIPKGYFLIPVYWIMGEWLMTKGVFGYPFFSLYLTQVGSPFKWLAFSSINGHALTLYLVTISLFFALLLTKTFNIKRNIVLFSIFFLIISSVAMSSFLDQKHEKTRKIEISVIQPNISQKNKTDEKLFDQNLNKYKELINKAVSNHPETDIVILPENIIPALWETKIKETLCFNSEIGNRLCIFGQPVKRDNRIYNSMLFYKHGDYVAEYHKRQLVPFGEYLPFLSDWVSLTDMIYYYPGEKEENMISIKSLKIGPLICFESAFSALIPVEKNYDLGVVLTNDAWFNKYFQLLHLKTVQFRAIEHQAPFAFSSNTGISAVIDHNGKIMQIIPSNKTGIISVSVSLPEYKKNALQQIMYFLPLWMIIFLLILTADKHNYFYKK